MAFSSSINSKIEYNCNDRLGYSCFTSPSWEDVAGSFPPGKINVLEIKHGDKMHYVSTVPSFNLASINASNMRQENLLKINGNFAKCLNLNDGQEVTILKHCNENSIVIRKAWVNCASSDDWEILEPNAEMLISGLLNQLRIVYPGLKFPFWITKSMAITLVVQEVEPACTFGVLDNTTEVIIPSLNEPQKQMLNSANDNNLYLRLHPIIFQSCAHLSLLPSQKLLFTNIHYAFIYKSHILRHLINNQELASKNNSPKYFYAKLISNQQESSNENQQSVLIVKVYILETLLDQNIQLFIQQNFPITNPPCLFIHQELISKLESDQSDEQELYKIKSFIFLEEVSEKDFEITNQQIQFSTSITQSAQVDNHSNKFGGYDNLISQGVDFLKQSLSLGNVQHDFVGPEHGNLLITGREGSGKTSLASRLIEELQDFPYFIHSEYLSCVKLRGKKPDNFEKELLVICERAIKLQPSIIILDDFDVLSSNTMAEQQQNVAEEFQHFRISETILSCILQCKNQQISFIITANSTETLNPYWKRRSGFHFYHLELYITPPDIKDRLDIFQKCLSRYQMLPENEEPTTTMVCINSNCGKKDANMKVDGDEKENEQNKYKCLPLKIKPPSSSTSAAASLDPICSDLTKSTTSSEIKSSSSSQKNKGNRKEIENTNTLPTTAAYFYNSLSPTMKKSLESLHDEYTTAQFISNLALNWTLYLFRRREHKLRLGPLEYDLEDDKEFDNVIQYEISKLGYLTETKLPPAHITWNQIGGLEGIKNELTKILQWPIKYAKLFENAPVKLPAGILFYGYPGTGKTLLGLSLPSVTNAKFIHIKGPELLSKYIGASEQAVKDTFRRAKESKPCILFFDEFESLVPRRGHDSTGVTDRVVNQFLAEMDGIDGGLGAGVYLVASTSRPDLIDPAILRPGRLDKHLFFPLPTQDERIEILKRQSEKMNLSQWNTNDWNEIGHATEGFTGADLQSLLFSAQLISIHEFLGKLNLNEYHELYPEEEEEEESRKQQSTSNSLPKITKSQISITLEQMRQSLNSFQPSLTGKEFQQFHNTFQNFASTRNGQNPAVVAARERKYEQRATLA